MSSKKTSHAPAKSDISRRRLAAKAEGTEYYLERVETLKKAAVKLFREKGVKDTNLDEVAAVAGIDRSSVYYYISSKRELFYEVVREAMEEVLQKVDTISKLDVPPSEMLEFIVVTMMDNYQNNYPHLYVYLQEDMKEADAAKTPQLRKLMLLGKRIDQILIDIIKTGIAEGTIHPDLSPKVTAYGIIGMINWTHRWFKPSGPMTGKAVGKMFAKIILDGVTTSKAAPTRSRKSN